MGRLAHFIFANKFYILALYLLLAIGSICGLFSLKFSFDFEQLFPQGDEDLAFFKSFTEDFEADDSFLLLAVERPEGVFDSTFLSEVDQLTKSATSWPYVLSSSSLTTMKEPVMTPFGLTFIPIIHIDQPTRYEADRGQVLSDHRYAGHLITTDGTGMVVTIRTEDGLDLDKSQELIQAAQTTIAKTGLNEVRYLGRPFFQKEMVDMQKRELSIATVVSGLLVLIVLILLFRRYMGVLVSGITVTIGLLLFMGYLSAAGRELNILSALYPLLMIIVGTSDVVHIMTKYISELRDGLDRKAAMTITLRQIGLATLLTSVTTAIGYLSLSTSRIGPVKDFGFNSAIGVMIAYLIAITFLVALLYLAPLDKLIKTDGYQQRWDNFLTKWYYLTINHSQAIILSSFAFLFIALYGISLISTNYKIVDNLPKGKKISLDYLFFEEKLSGFRPIEFAIETKDGSSINSFSELQQIDKLENYLSTRPEINSIFSYTDIYKTLNKAYHNNRSSAYVFPRDLKTFNTYKRKSTAYANNIGNRLINENGDKMRIMTKFDDLGADMIRDAGIEIDHWAEANLDLSNLIIKRTGTGLILDKNSYYVLESLLKGLALAMAIVSLLMMVLFRDWRMLIISMIPNLFPLLFAGAMLGFLGIDMEAGVSIVFAIAFGIAVDDTIHFLSKFKLTHQKNNSVEESIRITVLETGKAICLTTIILFFGFLVLLFSIHPPSITIGLLISVTLISALVSDIMLLPILLRWMIKT